MKKIIYLLLFITGVYAVTQNNNIYRYDYSKLLYFNNISLEIENFLKTKEKKYKHIAILLSKDGIVKVKHKNSIKRESLKVNAPIYVGDTIITYRSIATIKLNDNSIIKLAPHSKIIFEYDKITQNSGKIFYKIEKRNINHKLIVKTTFTTIGVKGTNFIVTSSIIALKEGILSVKGLGSKLLTAGNKVLFDGKTLKVSKMTPEDYGDFTKFDKKFNLNNLVEQNKTKEINRTTKKDILKIEVRNPKN